MVVYTLTRIEEIEYYGTFNYLVGIFETEEKAKAARLEYKSTFRRSYEIDEVEVQ